MLRCCRNLLQNLYLILAWKSSTFFYLLKQEYNFLVKIWWWSYEPFIKIAHGESCAPSPMPSAESNEGAITDSSPLGFRFLLHRRVWKQNAFLLISSSNSLSSCIYTKFYTHSSILYLSCKLTVFMWDKTDSNRQPIKRSTDTIKSDRSIVLFTKTISPSFYSSALTSRSPGGLDDNNPCWYNKSKINPLAWKYPGLVTF